MGSFSCKILILHLVGSVREIVFPREIEAGQSTPTQMLPRDGIGILMVNESGLIIS
jgi:hypothetical protein